jgi:hypothetical protein
MTDKPAGVMVTLTSSEKVVVINQGPTSVTIIERDRATGKVTTNTYNGVVLRKF